MKLEFEEEFAHANSDLVKKRDAWLKRAVDLLDYAHGCLLTEGCDKQADECDRLLEEHRDLWK